MSPPFGPSLTPDANPAPAFGDRPSSAIWRGDLRPVAAMRMLWALASRAPLAKMQEKDGR